MVEEKSEFVEFFTRVSEINKQYGINQTKGSECKMLQEWIKKNIGNLIITVIIMLVTGGMVWNQVTGEVTNIGNKLDTHLDDVKNSPTASIELQNMVGVNSNHIVELQDDLEEIDNEVDANHDDITEIKTMQSVIRDDQKEMKNDLKEILKLIRGN